MSEELRQKATQEKRRYIWANSDGSSDPTCEVFLVEDGRLTGLGIQCHGSVIVKLPEQWFNLARPSSAGEKWTHRHKKSGTLYRVIGNATLQCWEDPHDGNNALSDGMDMTVYQGEDGRLWVRPTAEFTDGRFEQVEPSAEEKPGTEDIVGRLDRAAYFIGQEYPKTAEICREAAARIEELQKALEPFAKLAETVEFNMRIMAPNERVYHEERGDRIASIRYCDLRRARALKSP